MPEDEEKVLERKIMRIKPIQDNQFSEIDNKITDALLKAVGDYCSDLSLEHTALEEDPRLGGYSYLVVFACDGKLYGVEFAIEVKYEATPYEFGRLPSDEDEG